MMLINLLCWKPEVSILGHFGIKNLEQNYIDYVLVMKALADETRIKIFTMLANGELCACEILEKFNITQPTLSYHMKILSESGLINSRKEGVWMKYSLNRNKLQEVTEWFNAVNTRLISSKSSSICCK